MYDPYTVDTPHDRAYRGMGGKNLQWITHMHFSAFVAISALNAINYGLDEYIIQFSLVDLIYRDLTMQ